MLTVTEGAVHDWENMPLSDMAFGNAMDCDFTLRAWKILKKEMKSLYLEPVYNSLLKDITLILGEVENTGIVVDKDYLAELDSKLEESIKNLEKELNELSPLEEDVNFNSTQKVAELLFSDDGFGLKPTKFSAKTKKPAITEEHLQEQKESLDGDSDSYNFINKLLIFKSKNKQYKTYVKGVEAALQWNEDGRIYSSYNFAATVTGRLSCSRYSAGRDKSKGVSFHTLPRPTDDDVNIRKLMRSDDEDLFIAADFSQAELRVLAQCSKDKNLIKAFSSGRDLHSYTASLIYGKSVDQVTKQERQVAKSVSFLIVYGGGPAKLSQQIGRSVGYCKNIFHEYQHSFPGVFKWIQFVHSYIRKNKCAVSLFGRRRNLPNVASPIKKYQFRALRQGMNFVIQSSASDMLLHAIKRLDDALKREKYDASILATVHDSVELQCNKSQAKEIIELMKETLMHTEDLKAYYGLDFKIPFEVDIEVGRSFGEGMEAEFDANGNLVNHSDILNYVQVP